MSEKGSLARFANSAMTTVLRSPFYFLAGSRTLLLTIRGRKSGKSIAVPVNYSRIGDCITIVSRTERTWWRNLRGGAPVSVRINGRNRKAWGTAIEDAPQVKLALQQYVQSLSRVPRRFRDLDQAVTGRVAVQIDLTRSN